MNYREPEIQEIDAISPSILNIFRQCPKKSAYYLDPEFNYLKKGSPSSSLGKIAHSVLADSYDLDTKFDSAQRLKWFEETWNKYEKNEFLLLQKSWAPSVIPKPISWNRYYAIKTSVKFKILKKSINKLSSKFQRESMTEIRFPIIEKYFINKEIGLKGKPDMIDKNEGFVTILDYKTGNINEDNKENYIYQLHLYLLLVEKELNIKVDKLFLFNSNYEEIEIDKDLLSKATLTLNTALNDLRQGINKAYVSFENCRYCPFKIHCKEFWQQSNKFPENIPLAIKAKVIEINQDLNTDFKVANVDITDSVSKNYIGLAKIYKIFNTINLQENNEYYFFNNINLINENNFKVNWDSNIYLVD